MPGWEGRAHVVGALTGGITNRNHVIEVDHERFVVRLPGHDTALLEIDRQCERIAAGRAADLGFGPEVLGLFDGSLVTRFVPGTEITERDFVTPGVLDVVISHVRGYHATAPLPHAFDGFAVPRLHRDAAASRGVPIPDRFPSMVSIVDDIASAFGRSPEQPVPCHNDLLRANFLREGTRIWLLDWEYAGMNDRWFDLGNLAVNNGLEPDAEEYLVAAYCGTVTTRSLARLRLMKIVSDAREAMWGVVQQGISTIDFDYAAYSAERFDRLFANAGHPRHPADLEAAAESAP